MGDSEEVIETFDDEELDGKKAGCEIWSAERDARTGDCRRHK
jgi:hypothetical protein